MKKLHLMLILVFIAGITGIFAQADMQESFAMIKKNLTDSKEKIKKYEWVETITTFVNGEQKSVKQNQCYYGVDGKFTKIETGGSTPAKTPGGLRGKIAANKKEEMTDYIEKATIKVQTYLPPDAEKIQHIYDTGKTAIQILEPGKKFRFSFPDYNDQGDMLSISIDKENQKIIEMAVNTFIDDPGQKVVFNITYNNLPDGTQYAGSTTLDVQAKNLKIVIKNSGFKKAAGQ